MSMSDPIADLLTRIRNAYDAEHDKVSVGASKLKIGVSEVLKKEGYIKDVNITEKDNIKSIDITLKYSKSGNKVIHEIKRVSKPGRRVYVKCDEIPKYKNGLGVSIISTSNGVMSDRIARNKGVGGELLCTVW